MPDALSGGVRLVTVGTDAELEDWIGVLRLVDPRSRHSAERARWARGRNPRRIDLLAVADGDAVAAGTVGPTFGPEDLDYAYASAWVLEAHRRRGLGQALYRAVSDHARTLGKVRLAATVRSDHRDGLAFVERRSFEETGRTSEVELPLDGLVPPPVEPPPGVVLVLRSERPDVVAGMYEVACEAIPHIPSVEPQTAGTFEQWRSVDVDRADRRADLCVVALAGDVVVAYGILGDEGETARHALTGVRRDWRRRGIAAAIKRRQIGLAVERGFSRLNTENDGANEPIRRLNEQLGYRPVPGFVSFLGPLAS